MIQARCASAGAGEDVGFDFVIARTGAEIHIIDPTRAVAHFDFIREQIEQDPKVAVYNARFVAATLNIGGIFKKVPKTYRDSTFTPSLWRVSRGLSSLPTKESGVRLILVGESSKLIPTRRLRLLPKPSTRVDDQVGTHSKLTFKLDIEGAEYDVLRQMLAFDILPGVLCIEFDGLLHGRRSVGETQVLLRRISSGGPSPHC